MYAKKQLDLIEYIKQKEQKMNQEVELVNIEQKAKECQVKPYFMMDILSGDFLGIFSVKNAETAIRSFCMSMDQMPEGIVHDTVLVDYETRGVVFEGKDYLEEWKKHHASPALQKK